MIAPELSYYSTEERRFAERLHRDEAAVDLGRFATLITTGGALETAQYSRTEAPIETAEQIPTPIATRSAFGRTALGDMMSREHDSKAALSYAGQHRYDLAA